MPTDEEDETIRAAVAKLDAAVAGFSPEKRIDAIAQALMTELPVDKGYEAFAAAWERINQNIEQGFTPRFAQALNYHLEHRVEHGSYQDKKINSTWLNRELRKHKQALAFPNSGEPSNLRALDAGYRDGRYCIERRADEARTSPSELASFLPLRLVPATPRIRATKEEMQHRTMAEREEDRRGRRGQRGHGEE